MAVARKWEGVVVQCLDPYGRRQRPPSRPGDRTQTVLLESDTARGAVRGTWLVAAAEEAVSPQRIAIVAAALCRSRSPSVGAYTASDRSCSRSTKRPRFGGVRSKCHPLHNEDFCRSATAAEEPLPLGRTSQSLPFLSPFFKKCVVVFCLRVFFNPPTRRSRTLRPCGQRLEFVRRRVRSGMGSGSSVRRQL